MTIILSSQEAASNADILQGTRLQNAPANGVLLFELQASDNDATNNYTVSIQLPSGDTPMEGVRVPSGLTAGQAGEIDSDRKLMASFPVQQGGHTVFSVTETGDAEVTWRVTFQPSQAPLQ